MCEGTNRYAWTNSTLCDTATFYASTVVDRQREGEERKNLFVNMQWTVFRHKIQAKSIASGNILLRAQPNTVMHFLCEQTHFSKENLKQLISKRLNMYILISKVDINVYIFAFGMIFVSCFRCCRCPHLSLEFSSQRIDFIQIWIEYNHNQLSDNEITQFAQCNCFKFLSHSLVFVSESNVL